MNYFKQKLNRAVTLMELLIAIAISTLLGATTVTMLTSSLDAYFFSEEQALVQKILDETLEEISGESMRTHGIKDALEILEAKEDSISFICLWVDDSHRFSSKKRSFTLNRPFKLGSPIPIFEFRTNNKESFKPASISFIPYQQIFKGKPQDAVILNEPIPTGSQVRIIFQPEPKQAPDVIMNLSWDSKIGRILRTYKNKTESIPKKQYKELKLIEAKFQYFDNTNTQIPASVPEELLSSISAVKITLRLESKEQRKTYQASSFVSLRNTHAFGKGIIIRQGTQIKIPDSHHIRTFSVGNIVGAKDKNVIQLKAQPQQGRAWRITIELGTKDKLLIIEKYSIEYPPGLIVYSEKINLSAELPFNLLSIGRGGRYDYDFDEDVDNVVDLKRDVLLTVEKMTAQGAAIFIRP